VGLFIFYFFYLTGFLLHATQHEANVPVMTTLFFLTILMAATQVRAYTASCICMADFSVAAGHCRRRLGARVVEQSQPLVRIDEPDRRPADCYCPVLCFAASKKLTYGAFSGFLFHVHGLFGTQLARLLVRSLSFVFSFVTNKHLFLEYSKTYLFLETNLVDVGGFMRFWAALYIVVSVALVLFKHEV
jgi:hypothetical protein